MKKNFLILALFMLMAPAAQAQTPVVLTATQLSLLNDAQDYLGKLKTVKASFVQINPSSSVVSNGTILLSKPGRLKMTYRDPYRIDYYINDDELIQYDYDLDEVTRGEAPDNPLKVLLYNDITLARNDIMNVTNITDEGDSFTIYMLNKASNLRDISGLILKFRKMPVELFSVGRVDYEGNNTQTNFSAIETNHAIDDSEFVFKKPKRSYPNSVKN